MNANNEPKEGDSAVQSYREIAYWQLIRHGVNPEVLAASSDAEYQAFQEVFYVIAGSRLDTWLKLQGV